MYAVVVVDAHEGSLSRYEGGGSAVRLTHYATNDQPCTFPPAIVEQFRIAPAPCFSVDPPFSPPPPGRPVVQLAA